MTDLLLTQSTFDSQRLTCLYDSEGSYAELLHMFEKCKLDLCNLLRGIFKSAYAYLIFMVIGG